MDDFHGILCAGGAQGVADLRGTHDELTRELRGGAPMGNGVLTRSPALWRPRHTGKRRVSPPRHCLLRVGERRGALSRLHHAIFQGGGDGAYRVGPGGSDVRDVKIQFRDGDGGDVDDGNADDEPTTPAARARKRKRRARVEAPPGAREEPCVGVTVSSSAGTAPAAARVDFVCSALMELTSIPVKAGAWKDRGGAGDGGEVPEGPPPPVMAGYTAVTTIPAGTVLLCEAPYLSVREAAVADRGWGAQWGVRGLLMEAGRRAAAAAACVPSHAPPGASAPAPKRVKLEDRGARTRENPAWHPEERTNAPDTAAATVGVEVVLPPEELLQQLARRRRRRRQGLPLGSAAVGDTGSASIATATATPAPTREVLLASVLHPLEVGEGGCCDVSSAASSESGDGGDETEEGGSGGSTEEEGEEEEEEGEEEEEEESRELKASTTALFACMCRDIAYPPSAFTTAGPRSLNLLHAKLQCNAMGFTTRSEQYCYGASGAAALAGVGMYLLGSGFNHACAPNVARYAMGAVMVYTAMRDIPPGEELTITYLPTGSLADPVAARAAAAADAQRDFTCRCGRCEGEEREDAAAAVRGGCGPGADAMCRALKRARDVNYEVRTWLNEATAAAGGEPPAEKLAAMLAECTPLAAWAGDRGKRAKGGGMPNNKKVKEEKKKKKKGTTMSPPAASSPVAPRHMKLLGSEDYIELHEVLALLMLQRGNVAAARAAADTCLDHLTTHLVAPHGVYDEDLVKFYVLQALCSLHQGDAPAASASVAAAIDAHRRLYGGGVEWLRARFADEVAGLARQAKGGVLDHAAEAFWVLAARQRGEAVDDQ